MEINKRPENREIYLCCIAKNEDHYIQEWIDYHFKIGFEKIFIFANDWEYENNDERIKVIDIKGGRQQEEAYNRFLRGNRKKFWWVAFWDVDEFLVLHKHKNIEELLLENDHRQALAIHWARFGSNGHKKVVNNNYNVLKRFTRRGSEEDHNGPFKPPSHFTDAHIKTIMRFTNPHRMGVHNCSGTAHTPAGRAVKDSAWTSKVDWSIAQLNHYWIKSLEEARIKLERGRATTGVKRDWDKHFMLIDKRSNTVEDRSAIKFFYDLE
jgi:hypothetical protein